MFPVLIIAIGIAVLAFGKRLAVLGAAVGALLGVALLRIIPGTSSSPLLALLIPILLAVIGFFVAGFAKGVINIVLIVLGALAGAAIMLGFLDLFGTASGLLDLLLAILGGVIGVILVQRFKDWGMIILAGLIGGLLVTRGLAVWFPSIQDSIRSLLVLVLAAASIVYQGGFLNRR
jgi:hypothetical protein